MLQFTHSHGVGTQGSPSFFGIISSDKEANAFTEFAVKTKVRLAICSFDTHS